MMTPAVQTWFMAAPKIPEGEGPEWGKAAPVGLLVIVLLCITVWLLVRSMTKHLRIVRERFPEEKRGFDITGAADGVTPDQPVPDTEDHADPSDADPSQPSGTDSGANHLSLHKD